MDDFKIVNAHWWRKCHRETCNCPTDFVLLKNGVFDRNVETDNVSKEISLDNT